MGFDRADAVLLPVLYEQGPSYGQGARLGALEILTASLQLERIHVESGRDWGQVGLHTLPEFAPYGAPETAVAEIKAEARRVMESGKFLLTLGGDHAVSIGPVLAAAEVFDDLGVLQIDAHLDLREQWNGSRYNHACVMRRVAEDARVPFVQVGIRSVSPEERQVVKDLGLEPFYAHEIDLEDEGWITDAIARLPGQVYLTLDLDGLDPSVIPGTGTPEPGGLSYHQVRALIRALGKAKKVVAADITELAKIPGSQVSEFTAARLATHFFVYCLSPEPGISNPVPET